MSNMETNQKVRGSSPRSARQHGHDIAIVLGIDPGKVLADSMRLEPFGTGWRVSWEGAAILHADAARILFGEEASA
ncbi:hypothetical protein [Microbacterium sp. USTB-Y]|uniref:hypothetical protein n=1 Tax=Microbacterium sp. USTB-Y TaxID=2823692 RepID=UPI00204101CB|nr:hypothetical protein [Microbacterium sp. USTB-Y]